ncbi:hypothetical protein H6776_02085 [Candidatus Nomurabacteria bacterium]|nr:hypothetical protein [Candidatus Nomurabacteria bacterium]
MYKLTQNSLEDRIIQYVHKQPFIIVDLIEHLQQDRPGTTKQAVYAAIRKLKAEEVVVVYKKQISLNKAWVQKMSEFFSIAKHNYLEGNILDSSFLNFVDGDKVSYRFQSPYITDQYWAHVFSVLTDSIPNEIPVMIYDPHQWFMAARKESELPLTQEFKKQKRLICTTVGHDTSIDKSIKKLYDGEYAKYTIDTSAKFKNNHYINIFNDFIIDVYLDLDVSKQIDNFYRTYNNLNKESIAELKAIVSQKRKNRFVISRNAKRAYKLRKQLAKNFFIPEPFRSHI